MRAGCWLRHWTDPSASSELNVAWEVWLGHTLITSGWKTVGCAVMVSIDCRPDRTHLLWVCI